jgi:hypothetical protein
MIYNVKDKKRVPIGRVREAIRTLEKAGLLEMNAYVKKNWDLKSKSPISKINKELLESVFHIHDDETLKYLKNIVDTDSFRTEVFSYYAGLDTKLLAKSRDFNVVGAIIDVVNSSISSAEIFEPRDKRKYVKVVKRKKYPKSISTLFIHFKNKENYLEIDNSLNVSAYRNLFKNYYSFKKRLEKERFENLIWEIDKAKVIDKLRIMFGLLPQEVLNHLKKKMDELFDKYDVYDTENNFALESIGKFTKKREQFIFKYPTSLDS